jgi:predicted DNA binding CopG/RHH family protein
VKIKLSKYEKEILDAYEKGKFKPASESEKKRHTNYAKEFMKKDYRLNIRISKQDLKAIQAKAMEEGLPYQTFISSVIHKVAHGKAVHHP